MTVSLFTSDFKLTEYTDTFLFQWKIVPTQSLETELQKLFNSML